MRSTFVALAIALVASATPVKRDAATVEADIAAISNQVSNLNTAINTFASSPTLINGLAIHTDAGPLESAINQGTTDATASAAFTEAEGSTILSAVQGLASRVVSTLQNLDAQHANFEALPLGGTVALVKADLTTLNTDTTNFENALLAKTPADIQASASPIISSVNAAFQTALATYSS